jgi:3-oxoacyl-[acyl-carrier protein] reductase
MNRLHNKIALITGGNTGIGRAVCLAFADEGADIAIAWYEHEEQAHSLIEAVRARGRRGVAVRTDVSDESQVKALVDRVDGDLGPVDILVNNAGIQKAQPITEMNVADWDRMLAVHLRGAFLCSREVTKTMIAQKIPGRIINLCSQLGYIGRDNYTAYSTAKGGMIAFTRALAKELAPHGILVNGVAPGLVDTGFDPLSDEVKQAHAAALPLKRLGTPRDMTSAFVFLAGEEGRYYCGQLLHPNGGEIMP